MPTVLAATRACGACSPGVCRALQGDHFFDLVGSGGSERTAYDRTKYGSLQGYADDTLEMSLVASPSITSASSGKVTASVYPDAPTSGATSKGVRLGSEFVVRLPLSEAALVSETEAAEAASVDTLRVLVVDDNADAPDTLAMALELLGCEANAVYTAAAGLEQLAAFAPQVALLDIGLPDMNGYEMARQVRAAPGGDAITLIAATGWGQSSDKQRALEAGFEHHLTKPIDFDQLQSILTLVKQF